MSAHDEVTQLLLDVRDNLDGDLALGTLARDFGRSPWHFHRVFSGAIGLGLGIIAVIRKARQKKS